MPFDSSGTFNRVRSWAADAAASIKIRSDYHDQHDGDLANGLSQCITKDGRTQPTANIPFNQKKIVNLGEPTADSDAATKKYVDSLKTFTTGMTITGANFPNGMLNFSATTGITGLTWVNADMSWVAKPAETGKWRGRIVATSQAGGAGTELITIDKGGVLGSYSGYFTNNLSYDGSDWRVNVTGTGSYMRLINGVFTLSSNDVATVQDNQIATMENWFSVSQTTIAHISKANSALYLSKGETGGPFNAAIYGRVGSENRWRMELGNAVAETGTAGVGSNFALTAYDNAGANAKTAFQINRDTLAATLYGDVIANNGHFVSALTTAILAAKSGGAIYLRPNGPTSTTEQSYVATDGSFHINGHMIVDLNTTKGSYLGLGQQGRNGTGGSYTGYWHNWLWSSNKVYALVNNTNVGAIEIQCDYRIKRNVKPMPSTWDKVKTMRPITFNPAAYGDLFEESDELKWGFIAHELQEHLLPTAAHGKKDETDVIQSVNLIAVIAGLTKTLQEAQLRIEALEAKLA